MKELDNFYLKQDEPLKSCFLALRDIILSLDRDISHKLKYGMPFFCYKEKMFCYLWVHKKYKLPYIGIVEGNRFDDPNLIMEKRSRMKIMLIDPEKDIPIKDLERIIKQAIGFYKSGELY